MTADDDELEDRPEYTCLLVPGAQVSKPKPDKKGEKRWYIYCKYKGPHDSGFRRVSSSKYFAAAATPGVESSQSNATSVVRGGKLALDRMGSDFFALVTAP